MTSNGRSIAGRLRRTVAEALLAATRHYTDVATTMDTLRVDWLGLDAFLDRYRQANRPVPADWPLRDRPRYQLCDLMAELILWLRERPALIDPPQPQDADRFRNFVLAYLACALFPVVDPRLLIAVVLDPVPQPARLRARLLSLSRMAAGATIH